MHASTAWQPAYTGFTPAKNPFEAVAVCVGLLHHHDLIGVTALRKQIQRVQEALCEEMPKQLVPDSVKHEALYNKWAP